jgi:hypothetical protein
MSSPAGVIRLTAAATFVAITLISLPFHSSALAQAAGPGFVSRRLVYAHPLERPASSVSTAIVSSSSIDGEWFDLAPPQRAKHAAIYDPLRDRMVVFGGLIGFSGSSNETWSFTLAGVPLWNRLATTGDTPPPAAEGLAIYDSARDHMLVLIAGYGVWSLSLSDQRWAQVSPSGSQPPPRLGTSAVYDTLRDRLLVFGGYASGLHGDEISNEVWALNLSGSPAWTQLAPLGTAPTPRYGHAAVYDRAHDRMVVFGGSGDYGALNNEVWALDLAGEPIWVPLSPSGVAPSARAGSLSILDAASDQMLVFGGSSGPGNDLWWLSLADSPSWTRTTPPGALPSARSGASLIFDAQRHRLLLYGGKNVGWQTWSLALSQGAQWSRIGSVPPGRDRQSAVHDPVTDRMIVFGGYVNGDLSFLGDLWFRDLSVDGMWAEVTPTGATPAPRAWHNAILDPPGRRMILFGGSADSDYNDTWALSLDGDPTWSPLLPAGVPPVPRWDASAIYDPARGQLVVFGGASSGQTAITRGNDVWTLSLGGTPTWNEIAPIGMPPTPRSGASAIYDPVRDRMLVFGGQTSAAGIPDTVWALAFTPAPAWSIIIAAGSPGGRFGHSAVYDPTLDRMIVFGGIDTNDHWSGDVWALSLSGVPQWTLLQPAGFVPTPRIAQSAIYDGHRNRMVLFGGFTPGQGNSTIDYNDTWALSWGDIPIVDVPRDVPEVRRVSSAMPNPTQGSTLVRLELPTRTSIRASVFDVEGRLVRQIAEGSFEAGVHTLTWDGTGSSAGHVGPGLYFCRIMVEGREFNRTIVMIH